MMAIDDEDILRARRARDLAAAANVANASAVAAAADPLQAYIDNSAKRLAELDTLSNDLQSRFDVPLKPINQMTPEELDAMRKARVKKQTEFRETGGGTTPPYPAPENTHWSFIGGEWKLYKDDPKVIEARENARYSGNGTKESPKLKDGKPFTGSIGTADYVDGILQGTAGGGGGDDSTTDATNKLIAEQNQKAIDAANLRDRQSAYDLLYSQFKQYGLESLVEGIKGLIQENVSPSESIG